MACILSLETSTGVCSAALHLEGSLVTTAEVHVEQSHASRLAVLISQLFKTMEIKPRQLDGVAIASGPGSYTGLRIGTSTAKGICYALKIPLIAVGTLELLAFQMKKFNSAGALLCPMVDARRHEVYCALMDAELHTLLDVHARVIDSESFAETLRTNRVIFFGDGSSKCKEWLTSPNAVFIDGVYPRAAFLGELAFSKWSSGGFSDVSSFEPFYLKDFMVKREKPLFEIKKVLP